MKRLFLSLVAAVLCTTAIYGQPTNVATLIHNGEIKAFYGEAAFVDAMSLSAQTYSDKTVSLVLTMGSPQTIVPYADLGIPASLVAKCYSPSDSNDTKTIGLYDLSDDTAISVVPTRNKNEHNSYYYSYNLIAQKTGFYTFKQAVSYYRESNGLYFVLGVAPIITYNITVVDVTSISIPNSISLNDGDNYVFSPVISQQGATTIFTWHSSNTSVATVDENGILNTTGIGTTTITCTAHNGVSAQCEVTVNPVSVSGITLNETETELTVGEKLQMEATIAPDNATDKSVTWSSTNEAVAVVSESGLVTAVGSGTCQIKATANDGSGKSASCLVTVEKNNKLTVTDMTQCSGGRGVLNVLLTDEEVVMGFQFDLQLPTGVTVAEDNNGNLLAALTGNAINTHSISSSKVSEGLYRFVVTPQGNRAISNANGDGMTITIDVADNMVTGIYDMTIKDIEMTVRKTGNVYEDIHPKNSTAKLTVTEAVMGDVNGDGRISVTDVISINSYILEEEPAQFIRKVADLNGDGKVTITDMVQVIDIILGR